MTLRILVIDGNTKAHNERLLAAGGNSTGESYAEVLHMLRDDLETVIVHPADEGLDCLPKGARLHDFDGFVVTGSALNAYEDRPEVAAQRDLIASVFAAGVPGFGSCWGLQITTEALGGKVVKNPHGYEFPYGRDITLTKAGRDHPMLKGKPDHFDALAVHMDEVEVMPEGAVLLASNAMSQVQALEVKRDGNFFWGVQYHPEFTPGDIAIIMEMRREAMVANGNFASVEALEAERAGLLRLQADPDDPVAERLHLDAMVTRFEDRTREIRNWLDRLAGPPPQG